LSLYNLVKELEMAAPISAILLDEELIDSERRKKKLESDAGDAAASDATPSDAAPSDFVGDADKVIYAEYRLPEDDDEEEEIVFSVSTTAASTPKRSQLKNVSTTPKPAASPALTTPKAASPAALQSVNASPAASQRLRLPHIPSIPNFRALLWDRNRNPVVFRSARQECIDFEDIDAFMKFDIRTIIDLRSCHEYAQSKGERLLDRIYPVFEVSFPKNGANFKAKEMKTTQVSYNYPEEDLAIVRQYLSRESTTSTPRRRLLIPICNQRYLLKLAKQIGGYHVTGFRAFADVATFFKFGFLTRHFVNHFNGAGQWRLYVSYLECGANAIVAALKIINEPDNLPVLFNCHIGKDRTGVLAALLLTLVGVARQDILKDFARSEDGIMFVRDEIREYMASQRMYWDEEFLHAFPDDLLKTLEFCEDKYGSINNFLHINGFTFDEQARLKDNLLAGSRNSTFSSIIFNTNGTNIDNNNANTNCNTNNIHSVDINIDDLRRNDSGNQGGNTGSTEIV